MDVFSYKLKIKYVKGAIPSKNAHHFLPFRPKI